jgi:hypothetical protein
VVLVFAVSSLLPQMQHLMDGALNAVSLFGSGVQ